MATSNFHPSTILGRGGFGPVYKGTWHGRSVAIKVLDSNSLQGLREYCRELELLRSYRHSHLVPLIGFCQVERDQNQQQALLVYPLMSGGALNDALGDISGRQRLHAGVRLRVAADIAAGLQYLHAPGGGLTPVLHRDIKSSNVLLDGSLRARISDVGLARRMTSRAMTMGVGTWGYIDPNYVSSGEYGPKSDVFSLGVVILELLTGSPASDPAKQPPHLYARMQARLDLSRGAIGAESFADSEAGWGALRSSVTPARELAKIGLECVLTKYSDRPQAAQVHSAVRVCESFESGRAFFCKE